jgi:hypothetical protein
MHEEKEWYLSKTSTTSLESILLGRSIEEKFTIHQHNPISKN